MNEGLISSVWDHIEALRRVLIKSLCVILVGFSLAFYFHHEILAFVTKPIKSEDLPFEKNQIITELVKNTGPKKAEYPIQASQKILKLYQSKAIKPRVLEMLPGGYAIIETTQPHSLLILSPIEGMTSIFKLSIWTSLMLSSPIWLYFILQFAMPGLKKGEIFFAFSFFGFSMAFLAAGFIFAYFVTIPFSNAFLLSFNAKIGSNLWSLSNYLDFSLYLMFANALAFEISLLVFFLIHCGLITCEWISSHRRHAVILILIMAAILTPPDVPSQIMLALPLMGLFELAVLYSKLLKFKSSHPIAVNENGCK